MRRFWCLIFPVFLLIALSGCGSGPAGSGSGGGGQSGSAASSYGSEEQEERFGLSAEWPTYGPDAPAVSVLAENRTGEDISAEAEWSVEREQDGAWTALSGAEGRTKAAITIAAHDSAAITIPLTGLPQPLEEGAYRVIAVIGDDAAAAPFTVSGDSPITAAAPYGLQALETLPENYSAAEAADDGCMVFATGAEVRNGDAMDTFLAKVRVGMPCQLRLARFSAGEAPVIEDVLFQPESGAERFTARTDNSRDHAGGTAAASESRYGFLTTDGWSIWLSHAAQWDASADASSAELLAGDEAAPYIPAVQALSKVYASW